jgi:hypothetical protein
MVVEPKDIENDRGADHDRDNQRNYEQAIAKFLAVGFPQLLDDAEDRAEDECADKKQGDVSQDQGNHLFSLLAVPGHVIALVASFKANLS